MKYTYVTKNNPFIRQAYLIGKYLYSINKWNKKTTPIALIVKSGKVVSVGVSGYGMHPILAHCDRENKPQSPYSDCKWCSEPMHAEMLAIKQAHVDLYGAYCVLYGHFYACANCVSEMEKLGIKEVLLMKDSDILFDRHKEDTVIGKETQFID